MPFTGSTFVTTPVPVVVCCTRNGLPEAVTIDGEPVALRPSPAIKPLAVLELGNPAALPADSKNELGGAPPVSGDNAIVNPDAGCVLQLSA